METVQAAPEIIEKNMELMDGQEVSAEDADKLMDEMGKGLEEGHAEYVAKTEALEEDLKDYYEVPVEEELRFELNKEELAIAATEIALMAEEKSELEKARKDSNNLYKSQISKIDATMDAEFKKIKQGEIRQTGATKRVYPDKYIVEFIVDGVVVSERKMHPEEAQIPLEFAPPQEVFASEAEAQDAGSGSQVPEGAPARLDEATFGDAMDVGFDGVEKVTQSTLTENKPVL